MKITIPLRSLLPVNLILMVITFCFTIATPVAASAQGKVLGLAFVGHHVSDLEKSIKFYETLDFYLQGKPTDWKVDKIVNRLGGTPGVESRTAVMMIQSSVSDIPFKFILREYRGIERSDWSNLSSSDLLSSHIDLTVQDDCNPYMDKLRDIGMLKVPNMNLSGGGEDDGPRRFVFVQDPDGWYVELFAIMPPAPGEPPPGPKVSNSTATFDNIDRLGKQPGFNHYALNIVDPVKAIAFYEGVLGGDYPPYTPPAPSADNTPRMTMLNGWFPQATTNNNLRFELIKFPQNEGMQPPDQKFADINVDYGGYQVTDIDAVYARAKAAGAITVSEGGIIEVEDGRAVLLRDPGVGGFLELWEPSK